MLIHGPVSARFLPTLIPVEEFKANQGFQVFGMEVCYRAFLWASPGKVSDAQAGMIICSFPACYWVRKWPRNAAGLKLAANLPHGLAAHQVVIAAQQHGEPGIFGQGAGSWSSAHEDVHRGHEGHRGHGYIRKRIIALAVSTSMKAALLPVFGLRLVTSSNPFSRAH